jgi:hypothetical protein
MRGIVLARVCGSIKTAVSAQHSAISYSGLEFIFELSADDYYHCIDIVVRERTLQTLKT